MKLSEIKQILIDNGMQYKKQDSLHKFWGVIKGYNIILILNEDNTDKIGYAMTESSNELSEDNVKYISFDLGMSFAKNFLKL